MSESANHDDVAGVEREIGQIARGAGVGLGGNIIFYAVSYLFGILIARQIGAEQYGLYTLGITAVTLISRITVAGLDRGLLRYASISRGEGKGAALRRLLLQALVVGGAFGIAGGLLLHFFPEVVLSILHWTDPDKVALLVVLPVFAVAVPAMALTAIAIAGTQAFRTIRYRALVSNVVQPMVKLLVSLLLILGFGLELMAPVLGFVIAQIVGTFLALFFLVRLAGRLPKSRESTAGIGRKLAAFSVPLMFADVVNYLNGRTEIIVLGIFLVANMAGIYNAAVRLSGLGLIVVTAFNAIFSPVISDLHHRGEMGRLSVLFKLVTRWVVAVAMPIFLVQMLFAPQLMALFGTEFVEGASSMRILSVGQMINLMTGAVGIMIIMSGRSTLALINSALTVLVALALDFWLVPSYGLMGAAVAGALVMALVNLIRLGEVWKLMHIHPFERSFLKPFAAGLAGLAAGLVWRQWLPLNNLRSLLAACLVVGIVYLIALLALGLDEGDRMVLGALRTRLRRLVAEMRPFR